MLNKKRVLLCFLTFIFIISILPMQSEQEVKTEADLMPQSSSVLDGANEVVISSINREANMSSYGLLSIRDSITLQNNNEFALNYFLIGIHENSSNNLIFFEAKGPNNQNYVVERRYLEMGVYEMILVYLSTPINPDSSSSIKFIHVYKDLLNYSMTQSGQRIRYSGPVFPVFPYTSTGSIKTTFNLASSASGVDTDWGEADSDNSKQIVYDFASLKSELGISNIQPLASNLGENQFITLIVSEQSKTKLEILELNRMIEVSPWGYIKVTDQYLMQNKGYNGITTFDIKIPGASKMVLVSDDLGELIGVSFNPQQNYTHLPYRTLSIDLSANRVTLTPQSKAKFTIEYHLIFERFSSINWIFESIEFDALLTNYEFLCRDQTITIDIQGSYIINSVSEDPDKLDNSQDSTILVYNDQNVTPKHEKLLQFTFTVNLFDILLRPIIFILIFAIVASAYVLIIKNKKDTEGAFITREYVPANEIREFCALYEEKNALYYEIRMAEENAKRKKIAKKQFRNIQSKNSAKIEEINSEITPFKEVLVETNPVFKNIVSKLEILEAERISVEDSMKLLETRYKRGRLPSAAAYRKLMDNFTRREQKINRSIDKLIQHLRSYLL